MPFGRDVGNDDLGLARGLPVALRIRIADDPVGGGVRYFLTVPPEGRGLSDAVNQRYPTIYENGAQIGVLVLEARNQGADLPDWRLYQLV